MKLMLTLSGIVLLSIAFSFLRLYHYSRAIQLRQTALEQRQEEQQLELDFQRELIALQQAKEPEAE